MHTFEDTLNEIRAVSEARRKREQYQENLKKAVQDTTEIYISEDVLNVYRMVELLIDALSKKYSVSKEDLKKELEKGVAEKCYVIKT